ncbi:MAG: vitamin K epoxide reductase family protein [Candidatus Woesearchaeota archaeon]
MTKCLEKCYINNNDNSTKNKMKTDKYKNIYYAALIIGIIGLIFSIIIHLEQKNYNLDSGGICSVITGSNGCEIVQTSVYGSIFGISNALYGIIGFSIITVMSLLLIFKTKIKTISKGILIEYIEYLTIISGIISGIVAIIFIYLQAFVLHAYCIFCLVVDITSIIFLVISLYWAYMLLKSHKNKSMKK